MTSDPSTPAPGPEPGSKPRSPAGPILLVIALALLLGGVWWWAVSTGGPGGLRIALIPGEARLAPFLGDRACARCHPGQEAEHAGSGHSRTLRRAEVRGLVRRKLDGMHIEDPEDPGVTWDLAIRDGTFQFERSDGEGRQPLPVDFAFGSGVHTTSFVTLDATDPTRPTSLEHRLTYYAERDALGITPGQKFDERVEHWTPVGKLVSTTDTLKCFGCHTSATSAIDRLRIDPETLIPNVTCERCHGSGKAHVEAVERGEETDLAILNAPGAWTAAQQMRLCGYCHRHPDRFLPAAIVVENPELVRHQPVGLMQSPCYLESDGRLSCTTCHDPHAKTSTDESMYVAACLSCHRPGPEHPDQHACPVSPTEDCLGCHMPRRDAGQGYLLTDHWIRVVGPEERLTPNASADSEK